MEKTLNKEEKVKLIEAEITRGIFHGGSHKNIAKEIIKVIEPPSDDIPEAYITAFEQRNE